MYCAALLNALFAEANFKNFNKGALEQCHNVGVAYLKPHPYFKAENLQT